MSWMARLYETYEQGMKLDLPDEQKPMPISHTLQNAHINIVISGDGDFLRAEVLEKTHRSDIRAGAGNDGPVRRGGGVRRGACFVTIPHSSSYSCSCSCSDEHFATQSSRSRSRSRSRKRNPSTRFYKIALQLAE